MDSITSWNDLVQKFLTKLFPLARISQLVQEINTFKQLKGENLAETWERFHELLRRCPHHRLTRWMQVHTFYNGLRDATRTVIDASARGALMKKTTDQAYETWRMQLLTEISDLGIGLHQERLREVQITRSLAIWLLMSHSSLNSSLNNKVS